ncbi:hypothetical protein I5F94_03285 [Proteus mirabilis]|uniref:hypothetical protein n=2 Tax=Proteus mirabilis TaxID=584 RepID=UPI000885149A|nr:hypothetical protein [Proteus mirabilis]MBG2969311.1 hypothetical protein [Proteus mirabilis]MBG6040477.1 hypothetical protein [Proteus mirabilis]MCU9563808.1 hypothetical protein [Proteus mirabilis]MDC5877591.1 hypothetical protein [Proteus mirabilis]MDC5894538.1 hypothetical protein [Proteus mirabilis]
MEWKGIPYSLVNKGIMESINNITTVEVDKIPTVVVSTSFSWETVVAAFFSALIPSLIAWYALKHNYRLAEYQNKLVAQEKWISDFRNMLAEYISELTIFSSNIITQPYIITSEDEKKAELCKYKLLLLLGSSTDAEIDFAKSVVSINNLIIELKKSLNFATQGKRDQSEIYSEINYKIKILMINHRDVIISKYGKYL